MNDVRQPEDHPIEKKKGGAGVVFGEGLSLSALWAQQAVEPIEMVEIRSQNAEAFKFEPAELENDRDEPTGKNYSGRETVHGVVTQRDRCVRQQE